MMETEKNRQLPFLDVMVTKNKQTLTTSVYRKITHTDRYLHYSSHHHPRIKTGIISCLRHRAETICSAQNQHKEFNHLKDVFVSNGYPPRVVHSTLNKHTRPKTNPLLDNERPKMLCLPYVKGSSEKVEKMIKPLIYKNMQFSNLT